MISSRKLASRKIPSAHARVCRAMWSSGKRRRNSRVVPAQHDGVADPVCSANEYLHRNSVFNPVSRLMSGCQPSSCDTSERSDT